MLLLHFRIHNSLRAFQYIDPKELDNYLYIIELYIIYNSYGTLMFTKEDIHNIDETLFIHISMHATPHPHDCKSYHC